ncbi:MAG: CopG family transcriptional regulator [Elusimicrobia bacterium CG1_02_56_21]|nr:MAG: CopG family transcriptional regulator [Elusimicrobia bacterium CG1_02_56_21]
MIAIRLPKEIELRLNTLATSTGRTKSYYVREALLKHLSNIENIYMAEKHRQTTRAGSARPVTLKPAVKRRGGK